MDTVVLFKNESRKKIQIKKLSKIQASVYLVTQIFNS